MIMANDYFVAGLAERIRSGADIGRIVESVSPSVHPGDTSVLASLRRVDDATVVMQTEHKHLASRVATLEGERERIAKVLAVFWETAPTTASSLQPILDLARELNPHLK